MAGEIKRLQFSDGVTVVAPTALTIDFSSLSQYATDGDFETAKSPDPAAAGDIYLNTTDKALHYYDGTSWLIQIDTALSQTLTNKSIDSDTNTISNIVDNDVKGNANINALKLGTGAVSNTEFDLLDGLTGGSLQSQLAGKLDTVGSAADNRVVRFDTDGTALQAGAVSIDDSGNMVGVADIELSGDIDKVSATPLVLGSTGAASVEIGRLGANTVIKGNLQVEGTTTTVDSATLDVTDANITVNKSGNQASADNIAGLTVEMSDATDAVFIYDKDVASRWKAGDTGSESEILTTAAAQTVTAIKSHTASVVFDDQNEVQFKEDNANGTNHIALKSPDAVTTTTTFKLPDGDGSNGQIMKTDGSANLGWTSPLTNPLTDTQEVIVSTGSGALTSVDTALLGNTSAIAISSDFVDADVDTAAETVEITAHGFVTGQTCYLTTTGLLPGNLATDTKYYIIDDSANLISFALTELDAENTIRVDITSNVGGGTHTVVAGGLSAAKASATVGGVIRSVTPDIISATPTSEGIIERNKWQLRRLTDNVSMTGVMSDITFNVDVGKTYRITLNLVAISTGRVVVRIYNGSFNIDRLDCAGGTAYNTSVIHTATSSSITFDAISLGSNIEGSTLSANQYQTHAIVEELNTHESTSDWTP